MPQEMLTRTGAKFEAVHAMHLYFQGRSFREVMATFRRRHALEDWLGDQLEKRMLEAEERRDVARWRRDVAQRNVLRYERSLFLAALSQRPTKPLEYWRTKSERRYQELRLRYSEVDVVALQAAKTYAAYCQGMI